MLDYTSRAQTPKRGEIVVFRNVNGFYAAVHVLDIKDDSRSHDRDGLRFRYAVQSNGSDGFAEFKDVPRSRVLLDTRLIHDSWRKGCRDERTKARGGFGGGRA